MILENVLENDKFKALPEFIKWKKYAAERRELGRGRIGRSTFFKIHKKIPSIQKAMLDFFKINLKKFNQKII